VSRHRGFLTGTPSDLNNAEPHFGTDVALLQADDGVQKRQKKEVLMPDDNRSNRGNRDDDKDRESRQSSGRQGGSDSLTDRERDEQGRFESEREGSSQEGSSKKK
jgi:hypothetical protein